MAMMRCWAGFHECRDVESVYGVARALKEAAASAKERGCAVELALEDIGDQQVYVWGAHQAVAAAAEEFAERGFEPEVCAASQEEFAGLDGRLSEGIGLDLEG